MALDSIAGRRSRRLVEMACAPTPGSAEEARASMRASGVASGSGCDITDGEHFAPAVTLLRQSNLLLNYQSSTATARECPGSGPPRGGTGDGEGGGANYGSLVAGRGPP